ncbi:MAG: TIM barrel protein [Gemmatimonadota bacterium]
MHRRTFIGAAAAATAASTFPGALSARPTVPEPFRISLAQWSLHRTFFGTLPPGVDRAALLKTDPDAALRGVAHPVNFPIIARRDYGLTGVEYVNTFMYGHADDTSYLDELNLRAAGEGVTNVLIMCDLEGALGDPDSQARQIAVDNHVKWLRAAAHLGCHAIRVNAYSRGPDAEQARLCADGLHQLATKAEPFGLHVIVENHGGLSSRPAWLMATLRDADHSLLGTLPDFGNFAVSSTETTDAYDGVRAMMPLARAVSAKSYDFGADGATLRVDFPKMMGIVLDAGYAGWVGIEYEGDGMSEPDGIRATRDLLLRIRANRTT